MEEITFYPGSFGEIIQGNFNNIDILCSSPVNIFTKVKVFECKPWQKNLKYKKSNTFLSNMLKEWGFEKEIVKFNVEINSGISVGKGFASSTADLCAVYYSLLKLFNREFNEDELIRNCIKIEPTDSIIFKEMTIFDYKNGFYKEKIGAYLEFYILVFEGKKIVNTVQFNKNNTFPLSKVDDIFIEFREAVKRHDIQTIGLVATESIIRNQSRLKYDILGNILEIKDKTEGCGVIGAHSGDALGIIYETLEKAQKAMERINNVKGYKMYILKTLKKV